MVDQPTGKGNPKYGRPTFSQGGEPTCEEKSCNSLYGRPTSDGNVSYK